jgi:hypothetical protein
MPAGDITQGYIFVPAEKSIDQVKMNAIVGQAYINPAFISAQTESTSSTTGDYFLLLKSGGTLAKIVLDNLASSLASTTGFQSQIWSTRLRSFNSVSNCNFECNQRSPGTTLTANGWPCDRWQTVNVCPTLKVNTNQAGDNTTRVLVPGTSFAISSKVLNVTLTTVQASLAAGDALLFPSVVDGPAFREIVSDVSSLSLLVFCTSPLKFAAYLREPTGTPAHSIVRLCTIPAGNVWTLIQWPNIPTFPTGTFSTLPGTAGYEVGFSLACGSTFIASAANTWQNGNFVGAPGMDNFGSLAVNSVFQAAFIQHEPGALATTLIDKPFSGANGNYEECLRFYQKTYDYPTAIGTATANGALAVNATASAGVVGTFRFVKPMAKVPSVQCYSPATGTAGNVRDVNAAVDRTASSLFQPIGLAGFSGYNLGTPNAAATYYAFHYTADTGW